MKRLLWKKPLDILGTEWHKNIIVKCFQKVLWKKVKRSYKRLKSRHKKITTFAFSRVIKMQSENCITNKILSKDFYVFWTFLVLHLNIFWGLKANERNFYTAVKELMLLFVSKGKTIFNNFWKWWTNNLREQNLPKHQPYRHIH